MHTAVPPLSADISAPVAFVLIKDEACFKYPKPGRMCGRLFTKLTEIEKKSTSLLEKVFLFPPWCPTNTQKVHFSKPEGQKVTRLAALTVSCQQFPQVSASLLAHVFGRTFFPLWWDAHDNRRTTHQKEKKREKEINKYSPEQSSSLDIGKHSINQYNGEYKACGALLQVAEDL